MSYPEQQRLTLAYFTQPPELGQEFDEWPQHLTLFPPIIATPDIAKYTAKLVAENAYEFPITIGEEAYLGEHRIKLLDERSTRVTNRLHVRALEVLKARNVEMSGLEYIGADRTPYITLKEGQPELVTGDVLLLNHIAVVRRLLDEQDNPFGPQKINEISGLKPRV